MVPRMRTLPRLAALLSLLSLATPARAAQAVALSVEGLTRVSDAVVRGQVQAVSTTLSEDGRRVFTLVDVAVAATWRGEAARTVRVIVPGGVAGRIGQRVEGAPAFAAGEEVVVFLHRAEAGGFRVAGLAQGKFRVAGPAATPDLAHLRVVASEVGPGELAAGPMTVAELEQRVRSVP